MSRSQATEGAAALASIVADSSTAIRLDADAIGALATQARDAVLVAIADDRGLDDLDHTGMPGVRCVVRLEIGLGEIAWIASYYRHQIAVAGLDDPMVLVGHHLVATTASGERMVRRYESGTALDDAWANSRAVSGGLGWV